MQISRDDYCAEQKTSVAYWSSTSTDSQEFPEVKYIHFKDGKIMKKIYLTQGSPLITQKFRSSC
jgi:hypothetical protein